MPWHLFSPELTVSSWIILILGADMFMPKAQRHGLWILALCGIALSLGWLMIQQPSTPHALFQNMFAVDRFSIYWKGLFLLVMSVVIVMVREFQHHLTSESGAFYMLLFTALLGMFALSSSHDLLLLFVSLELVTFSLYIMTAYLKTNRRSVEAGMKYLILGSVSSAFLVYGIALLYGFSGSTNFTQIREALSGGSYPLIAQAGLWLVFAGLGFKIAAVPFCLWVPDVYEGAPTPVVALLSVGSKMAGIVALIHVFYGLFLPFASLWEGVLAALSAATMLYGNLGALAQTNIKRLLGYSSIGHAGYLLMGLSTATPMGLTAVGYYVLAYIVSNLTVFLVVVAISDTIGSDALDAYNGLSKRSPFLSAAMFLGLLSLAGVPPLAGFVGKLFVLLASAQRNQLWLVAIGAVNVVISLYYYLMIVKRMYLGNPREISAITLHPLTKWTLVFLMVGILALGILQEPFLQYLTTALIP